MTTDAAIINAAEALYMSLFGQVPKPGIFCSLALKATGNRDFDGSKLLVFFLLLVVNAEHIAEEADHGRVGRDGMVCRR